MKNVRLGRTEIIVTQNAFGCLPIQRDTKEVAVKLLREAYEGGMRFFDTARSFRRHPGQNIHSHEDRRQNT